MRLAAQIDAVFMDRHEALREAVGMVEASLSALEASGGRLDGESTQAPLGPRWTAESEDSGPRVRVHNTPPLRLAWNAYVAELLHHLDREEALLPALARGLAEGQVDAETITRKVTALVAEHASLHARTVEVRKAFLRVLPLLRTFSQVEEEFRAHIEAEEAGLFRSLLQCADSGLDLDDTPTTGRYERVVDPTRALRDGLPQRASQEEAAVPGWLSWFKKVFSRRRRIRY